MKGKILAGFCLFACLATAVHAEDTLPVAQEHFVGKDFASLIFLQEQNGKRGFKLTFAKPKKPIIEEKLELAGYSVVRQEYPFEKGEQTLLAQYLAQKNKEKRKILVLYSGYIGLLSNSEDYYFYVAEEYEKSIRYHAMFKSKPTAEQLKPIVEKALANPDGALVATRWAGKESEVFIYDSNRLTK